MSDRFNTLSLARLEYNPDHMRRALDDIIMLVEFGPLSTDLLSAIGRLAWGGIGNGSRYPDDAALLEDIEKSLNQESDEEWGNE